MVYPLQCCYNGLGNKKKKGCQSWKGEGCCSFLKLSFSSSSLTLTLDWKELLGLTGFGMLSRGCDPFLLKAYEA